jgi:hypothetical protein
VHPTAEVAARHEPAHPTSAGARHEPAHPPAEVAARNEPAHPTSESARNEPAHRIDGGDRHELYLMCATRPARR